MPINETNMDEEQSNIIEIDYFEQSGYTYDELLNQTIKTAMETALYEFDLQYKRISVALMNDSQIHMLNRDYRDVNRATDVLSFAAREGDPLLSSSSYEFLGDIAISLDTAKRQAEEYGQSYLREISFLCIHGCLHLLGYDHIESEDEKEMRQLQREIMEQLLQKQLMQDNNNIL